MAVVILYLFFEIQSLYTPQQKAFTITVSDSGFSPKKLMVEKGTAIVFINKSSKHHWIASNNHPTHELYPEFDMKKPLNPGEQWLFPFQEVGRWKYHDHLNPKFTGEVTVIGQKSKRTKDQKNKKTKEQILADINRVAEKEGIIMALAYLKNNYLQQEGAHDVAHALGSRLYKEKGLEGITSCDISFAFGCFHGFTETFIEEQGLKNISQLTGQCHTALAGQLSLRCYHGIGHGIVSAYGYDLSKALVECDAIAQGIEREYCYNGVFMENSMVKASEASRANPLWPCDTLNKQYQPTCYIYLREYLRILYSSDLTQMVKPCRQVSEPKLDQYCLRGMAEYIAMKNRSSVENIVRDCAILEKEQYLCRQLAIDVWSFQGWSLEGKESVLCASPDQKWNSICKEKIKEAGKNIQ